METMNKEELIKVVAEDTKLSKKDLEIALKGFVNATENAVANGEKVQLVGFGTFEPRVRAARDARKGRNPFTGADITIPAQSEKIVPGFKAGKKFKEKVVK